MVDTEHDTKRGSEAWPVLIALTDFQNVLGLQLLLQYSSCVYRIDIEVDLRMQKWLEKASVRSGIRTHAWRTRLRPERSALDRSAILTQIIQPMITAKCKPLIN